MKNYIYITFIAFGFFTIFTSKFTSVESYKNYNLKNLFSISSAFAESGDCNNAKETLTASKLICTSVEGQIAIDAGVTIGTIWDASLGAEVQAAATWESTDCYKIICYDGAGTVCCTELDWTACVSSGCPSAGIIYAQ